MKHDWFLIVLLLWYCALPTSAQTAWADKSNGINGGEISALALSGSNLWAGTNGGGLFLLADGTSKWVRQANGFKQGSAAFVFAIGINGANIFVGTGDGVYFSINGGSTWSKASIPNSDSDTRSILVTGTTIYAGSYFGNVNVSVDNGTTWKTVKLPIAGGTPTVTSLAISGTRVFAGTFNNGLFTSTDGGNTWVANASLTSLTIRSLAVSAGNVYAGTVSGLFFSADNGVSWSSISTSLSNPVISSVSISGISLYVSSFDGLFVSKNNGVTWAPVSPNYGSAIVIASGLNIFVGNTRGVFFSGDEGVNWSINTDGLTAVKVNCFDSSGSSSFIGTPFGVFTSQDSGASWTLNNTGLTSTDISAILVRNNFIFAGSISGTAGIFRSADNGATWSSLGNPGPNFGSSLIYALAANGNFLFAATTSGIYRSADNGTTWTAASTSITQVLSLAVDGSTLYAGTNAFFSNSSIYFSTDNGDNWTKTSASFTTRVDGVAATGNTIYAATGGGVYLSQDKGATWKNVTSGFCTDVILVSGNPVVASYEGIRYSNDSGNNWTTVNTGLLSTTMTFVSASNNALYAGTFGSGLWSRAILEICNPPVPSIAVVDINTATPSLISSSLANNQWFLNGSPIAGATKQTYVANETGTYKVVVTLGNCSSTSMDLPIVIVGLENEDSFFSIYPNPAKELITAELGHTGVFKDVSILSATGVTQAISFTADKKIELKTSQLSQGVYLIKVLMNGKTKVARFVKE